MASGMIDLSLIQGGSIDGLETHEVECLMDEAIRSGRPVNQHSGFNQRQEQDFVDLMTVLEQEISYHVDESERILPEEAERLIQETIVKATSKTTAVQTKQYVDKFRTFLHEKGFPTSFEEYPDKYLVKRLQFWLVSARRKDGKLYAPSTYTCMRAAIHRHLVETKNRAILGNIKYAILDKTVKACVAAYLAQPKESVQDSGYKAIEQADMVKLHSYFNRTTPTRLLWEVFFLIIYHFGFRGREWLRSLTKSSVLIKFCPITNLRYVDLIKEIKEKNVNQTNPESCKQILMYEKPTSISCPVQAIQLYLSKLPHNSNVLFPKPKIKFQDDWYSEKEVLGKHTLFDGMKKISELANLSKIYTNHCIRASVVTTLSEQGFTPSEIQTVTGQKRIETIERYTKRISSSKKMKLSHALSCGLEGTNVEASCSSTSITNTIQVTGNQMRFDTAGAENDQNEKTPTLVIEKNGARVKVFL